MFVDLPQVSTSQMYHTWFFQKRVAEALNSELKGLHLLACFSQQKDELVLSFGNANREFHIRADMSSQAGILSFRNSFARARRNSVDLFGELLDKKVISVEVFTHERSFFIKMEGELQLIFKMHGSRSSILFSQGNRVLKIFRNDLLSDLKLIPSELNNPMRISKENVLRLLGKKNKHVLDDSKMDASSFIEQLHSNSIYIGLKEEQPNLCLVETANPILVTDNAVEAANCFANLYYQHFQLVKEKKQASQMVGKWIKQSKNYIQKTSHKLDEITNQRSLEEVANILMANLHVLKPSQTEAFLDDFYTNSKITIKLNPKLSPQKNAENYYRKSKNKKIELQKLQENISSRKKEAKKWQGLLDELLPIDNLKELRAFISSTFGKTAKKKNAPLPYHTFVVDGYDVLVGKHAKSNDILTQKIAKPNDLWLHARDVPGSHVVIREKPGRKFPTHVIERVAALAAWYSKRKTDSLCPVLFTPKKYVRKKKGAPAGQVVVEKEEVVMAVPSNKH